MRTSEGGPELWLKFKQSSKFIVRAFKLRWIQNLLLVNSAIPLQFRLYCQLPAVPTALQLSHPPLLSSNPLQETFWPPKGYRCLAIVSPAPPATGAHSGCFGASWRVSEGSRGCGAPTSCYTRWVFCFISYPGSELTMGRSPKCHLLLPAFPLPIHHPPSLLSVPL
jgi:hypothetical protein